jgi:hypothetical protein
MAVTVEVNHLAKIFGRLLFIFDGESTVTNPDPLDINIFHDPSFCRHNQNRNRDNAIVLNVH